MDPFRLMTPEEIATVIDFPLDRWHSYCFIVVRRMLQYQLVNGVEAKGPSPFPDATFHFWIRTPDGGVVDPTRWCWEGAKPYIHVGPASVEYHEQQPPQQPSGFVRIRGRSIADNLRRIGDARGATEFVGDVPSVDSETPM